jgi:DNA adenine methylase
MAYQGGKARLGKRIYEALLKVEDALAPNQTLDYFEPFVGFGGVIAHFGAAADPERDLYACDANPDIIQMWKAVQRGWRPDGKCSVEKYEQLRESKTSPERTLYGHTCGFGGNFFAGFVGEKYAAQGARRIAKLTPYFKDVHFLSARSYDKFKPRGLLIYCDPPYLNNQLRHNPFFQNFDHDKFWDTMRRWSKHNIVVVSEYAAPDDFESIWEIERNSFVNNAQRNRNDFKNVEKLFIYKDLDALRLPRHSTLG